MTSSSTASTGWLILNAILSLSLPSKTSAVPYTNLYVFGAVMEEMGNNKNFVNYQGRYVGGGQTNGPVYVEYLYELLGLGKMKPSSDGGTNYAWATLRSWPEEHDQSVAEQVEEFLSALGDTGLADTHSLYLINGPVGNYWMDHQNPDKSDPIAKAYVTAQAESTMAYAQRLIDRGAVHVVIPQKLEPSQFLGSQVLDQTQRFSLERIQLATENYNTALGNLIAGMKTDSTRVTLIPFQPWVAAGIKAGLVLSYASAPEPKEHYNDYFNLFGWGDYSRPTTAAQAIYADVILELINRPPVITNQIDDFTLSIEDEPWGVNLIASEVFVDDDEDDMTFTVSTLKDSVVQAVIKGSQLTLVPIADGSTLVTVRASDGGPKAIPMAFNVTVISAPGTISLDVESLSFTDVEVRSEATVTLTINNTGEGPLNVTDITFDIAGLSPSETEFTIAIGESKDITLTYKPTTEGEVTGSLTILSNDADNGTMIVPLTVSTVIVPADPLTDFNGDGQLNLADFILFAQNYGSSNATYDLNGNGVVDLADFVIFVQNYSRPLQ